MEFVKTLVLISICILYPLFPGGLFCVLLKRGQRQKFAGVYLHGLLLCGAIFAALSFVGVRIGFSLKRLSVLSGLMWGAVLVLCVAVMALWKTYRDCVINLFRTRKLSPGKWHILMAAAFLMIAALYVIRPFPLEPGFVTPEQVVTVLDTGLLSGTDVLTGEAVAVSGNWKDQVCNLHLFYACLCDGFGLSPSIVLFSVIPFVVLLAAFCVISLFAENVLGGEEKRKAAVFVLFALITLCGNSAYMNTSYGLLHFPYEPMTIFSSVVLPLVLAFVLSREHLLSFLLIVINAVFLAGVYRGLALLVMALFGVAAALLVTLIEGRRGKLWT